jgi:hypothetical protein
MLIPARVFKLPNNLVLHTKVVFYIVFFNNIVLNMLCISCYCITTLFRLLSSSDGGCTCPGDVAKAGLPLDKPFLFSITVCIAGILSPAIHFCHCVLCAFMLIFQIVLETLPVSRVEQNLVITCETLVSRFRINKFCSDNGVGGRGGGGFRGLVDASALVQKSGSAWTRIQCAITLNSSSFSLVESRRQHSSAVL